MVFPLQSASTGALEGAGEAVATYIGYALEGTAPLRWLEARDFFGDRELRQGTPLARPEAIRVAREQRAGFYIDGSILEGADSVTVVLRLHDVDGDSVVRRAGASSRSSDASLPQLGLSAVGDLLPALLEPGRKVDLTALSERRPTAIAHFLQGEREYRRMRFNAALAHYHKARGGRLRPRDRRAEGRGRRLLEGQAGEAAELITVALHREADLPPRLALFARGLRSTAAGQADSAWTTSSVGSRAIRAGRRAGWPWERCTITSSPGVVPGFVCGSGVREGAAGGLHLRARALSPDRDRPSAG